MFPGRVGAVFSRLNKQESHRLGMPKKAPTLTAREQELELAKIEPIGTLKDFDIYELNNRRLRFRKYPWPFWLIGGMFANGVLFLVYLELTNQIKIKRKLKIIITKLENFDCLFMVRLVAGLIIHYNPSKHFTHIT